MDKMSSKYADQEIREMMEEVKPLPDNYLTRLQLREKRGHKEREIDVTGMAGNTYRLILRLSDSN
jgi:hypothetical protein